MADQDDNSKINFDFDLDDLYGQDDSFRRDIHDIAKAFRRSPDLLNNFNTRRAPTESQSRYANNRWKFENRRDQQYRSRGNLVEDFEHGLTKSMLDAIAGDDFKKGIQRALSTFQENFGYDLRNIGLEAGKQLGGKFVKKLGLDKAVKKGVTKLGNGIIDILANDKQTASSLKGVLASFFKSGGASGSASNGLLAKLGGKLGGKAGATGISGGAGSSIAGGSAGAAVGWAAAIVAIVYVIAKILGPALEGLAKIAIALGKSFNREEDLRRKRAESARKRLEADMNWMAEKPFKILEEAAKKWEDTWDSHLRTIGQTQGYDKSATYALYENYAERLRRDKLDSVINATDIIDKLSSVLSTGLSGEAAEEFAYIATKLGAAIPTQDFFSYAETYASIAANAIAQGQTQEQALELANTQLEEFASNLLYSSRELAGGFSTGLKNSSSLFKDAVQIAQSAKISDTSLISGTLTSVSAIIGSIAPDMADTLVSNVVQAAIGGNSSSLVALRSLAGINAGNTEFLRALAENPQKVFSTLFSNLAQMQNMSPDNYMEVAEGLADIFGIDKAAFARVDFNYLSQAIAAMNTNNSSLNENLALLKSGQTTTSAEQLKAQEINRVILDEGLAYVIDSEVGRMVQEHMWEEQMSNAMMDHTYGVELQGAALDFLEGIRRSVTTLYNFLNPIGFIANGIANMTQAVVESIDNTQDLAEALRLGAIGGNSKSYYNLTTYGKDLGLTTSLIEMMGGEKGIATLDEAQQFIRVGLNGASSLLNLAIGGNPITSYEYNWLRDRAMGYDLSPVDISSNTKVSRYGWSFVGKSVAQAMQNTAMNPNVQGGVAQSKASASQRALESSKKRFQEFVDTAEEASKTMTYEGWIATAINHGISDFAAALDDYGRSEEELRAYFEMNQAQEGARQETARKEDEQLFRDENRAFWNYASGNGIFQSAIWLPFFGDGQKYDTRMNAVDTALTDIQARIGSTEKHTVISGIEEVSRRLGDDSTYTVIGVLTDIDNNIANTFVSTSSVFQKCLKDWTRYIAAKENYTSDITKSTAWSELKQAEGDKQNETLLALANAMNVFSADELKKLDPQLQTNVLLGEIVIILQSIMQQNNSQFGGLSLPDTLTALGFGVTSQT